MSSNFLSLNFLSLSCIGSLPYAQRCYAPLGLLTTRDEPHINLFVKREAERNQPAAMLFTSEDPSFYGWVNSTGLSLGSG